MSHVWIYDVFRSLLGQQLSAGKVKRDGLRSWAHNAWFWCLFRVNSNPTFQLSLLDLFFFYVSFYFYQLWIRSTHHPHWNVFRKARLQAQIITGDFFQKFYRRLQLLVTFSQTFYRHWQVPFFQKKSLVTVSIFNS